MALNEKGEVVSSAPVRDDGGRAFPCTDEGKREEGMSLRDWFAGKALMGELACSGPGWGHPNYEKAATAAYEIADAMLAESRKDSP